MILDSVIDNLEAEGLLRALPRTHLILAYSGGVDSTALLYALAEIRQTRALDVTAAYYNHGWRGTPPEELPLIHRNCLATETPLVILQSDRTVPKTENAARQARYRQLLGLARDLQADAVLTAHHADDQIETLLFRLFRGTGIDGLVGIQKRLMMTEPGWDVPAQGIPVLRPLLDTAQKRIRQYVEARQAPYFEDPTNADNQFQRNQIRNQVLPLLEQSFPQVKNALFRLSLVTEGDLQIVNQSVQDIWQTVYGEDRQGAYLDSMRFNQLGVAYQRRILKRFLNRQRIHPDFNTIEDLLFYVRGEGRRKLDSALKSLVQADDGRPRFLALYKNRLRLIDAPPAADAASSSATPVPVVLAGDTVIANRRMTFKAIPWHAPDRVSFSPVRPTDARQVYVDLSAYADKPVVLRTRRPGDKFQPMGMTAPVRFKKFLINRGVPRFERDQLLVLAHDNQILWVPGLGISQTLRVPQQKKPTHLLCLEPDDQPGIPLLMPVHTGPDDEPEDDDDAVSSDRLGEADDDDEAIDAPEDVRREEEPDDDAAWESADAPVAVARRRGRPLDEDTPVVGLDDDDDTDQPEE